MRKVISKILMWLLLIWPNVYLVWAYIITKFDLNADDFGTFLEGHMLLAILIFTANVVNVFAYKNQGDLAVKWSLWSMIIKIGYIPFFLSMVVLCLVMGLGVVMLPMYFFITIPNTWMLASVCLVVGWIMLVVPSLYAVRSYWTARKEGWLSTMEALVLSFLSFIFVADVICVIVGFIKIKKKQKMQKIEKSS